jgi:phage protein D
MATMSMFDASQDAHAFYVPQFKLVAHPLDKTDKDGNPMPADVVHDVTEVTYKDKLEEIDSCELVINNWDEVNRCFKYIGAETLTKDGKPDGSDPNAKYWNLFDPCQRTVELLLGYSPGDLTSMMLGNFVSYEPNFPQAGPPVMSVRMLNLMHALRTKKYDKQYTTKDANPLTDSAIANWIAKQSDPDSKTKKRFPVKLTAYGKKEPPLTYVIQKSQYDIDFLWQRARQNGYELRFDKDARELVFQPSQVKDTPVYQLEWGQSLLDFKPTLTVGNQYKSVTVRYFDRATQKPVDVKLDYNDPKVGKLNSNLDYLIDQCDPREETVIEKPFYSKAEAEQYCASVFADQRKRMVKASGTTIGLPNLRAGCKIQIGGVGGANGKKTLGTRLSGTYFVTATTHTFNSSGYTTKFEARREDEGTGA